MGKLVGKPLVLLVHAEHRVKPLIRAGMLRIKLLHPLMAFTNCFFVLGHLCVCLCFPFDMDGVLVDTEWFYNRRRVAFMEEKGFHFDEIPDLSGSNEPAIWEALVPDDVELRERLRVEYKQVYSPDHPVPYAELLNEQTDPVMRELHERGVKCAIASSSYRELIDELVGIAGIADVLDYTISGHECSAFKPDPEIYLRAMEALGVEPAECLVIEDSPLGIEAGKRSGARVLALRPHEGVNLDQSRADAVIDNLTDILAAL